MYLLQHCRKVLTVEHPRGSKQMKTDVADSRWDGNRLEMCTGRKFSARPSTARIFQAISRPGPTRPAVSFGTACPDPARRPPGPCSSLKQTSRYFQRFHYFPIETSSSIWHTNRYWDRKDQQRTQHVCFTFDWSSLMTGVRLCSQWFNWSCESGGGSPDEDRLEQTPNPFHTQLIWRYLCIK